MGRVLRRTRPPGEYLYRSLDFADRKSVSVLMYVSMVGVPRIAIRSSSMPRLRHYAASRVAKQLWS